MLDQAESSLFPTTAFATSFCKMFPVASLDNTLAAAAGLSVEKHSS
jgi:hypothetical protein